MPYSSYFNTHEEYLKWYRNYRLNNRDKMRAYNREYNRKWRQKNGYHNELKSQKKYPLKYQARYLLRYAVKIGNIKKLSCIICGNKKSEAHHNDYSKPLEVIWYCKQHHIEFHKRPQELKANT